MAEEQSIAKMLVQKVFSDPIYVIVGAVLSSILIAGAVATIESIAKYALSPIEQKQAIGNPQPDIYIQRDGVKYYSRVDGKSIDELVKQR